MISFIVCLLLLITGYLTYGKIVDKTFGPDDRETPAVRINDGVDYVGHAAVEAVSGTAAEHRRALARSSVPCRVPSGARLYSCESHSAPFLPAAYTITSPA